MIVAADEPVVAPARPVDPWPDHAVRDPRPGGLAAVLLPFVTLAIWTRDAVPPVPAGDALAALDDIALRVTPCDAERVLCGALADAGYPAAMLRALAADIARQVDRLADLAGCTAVKLRLDVIETDACRRFHADYVALRLICTYAGPGTQWLTQADAARFRAGTDPAALTIRSIATGDVAIFKGHDRAGDAAIVHRSPPIVATGGRRLILVLDPA